MPMENNMGIAWFGHLVGSGLCLDHAMQYYHTIQLLREHTVVIFLNLLLLLLLWRV